MELVPRNPIHTVLVILGLYGLYLGGYGCYRSYGPQARIHPPGGGPYQVLVATDTAEAAFLARLFSPCVAAENLFYELSY